MKVKICFSINNPTELFGTGQKLQLSRVSVFQVKVLNVSQSYYDKYEMEITRVIKLGESVQLLCVFYGYHLFFK